MSNLQRSLIMIILFIFVLTFFIFTTNAFASNINMNLSSERNVTDEENPGNNIRNSSTAIDSSSSSLDTNTVTSIESIDEYNEPTSSFGTPEVLNIFLLAVGLVLILLAVAILIRLGK